MFDFLKNFKITVDWDVVLYCCFGLFGDFFLKSNPRSDGLPLTSADISIAVPVTAANIIMFFFILLLAFWFFLYLSIYTLAVLFDLFYRIYLSRNTYLIKYWYLFLYIIYELPDWLVEYAAFAVRKLAFKNMEPFILRTLPEVVVVKNRWLFIKLTFISFIVADIIDLCKSQILIFRVFGLICRVFFDFFFLFYLLCRFLVWFFRLLFNLLWRVLLRLVVEVFHLSGLCKRLLFALFLHPLFYYYFCIFLWSQWVLFNSGTSIQLISNRFVLLEFIRLFCSNALPLHAYCANIIILYRRWAFRFFLISLYLLILLLCFFIFYAILACLSYIY